MTVSRRQSRPGLDYSPPEGYIAPMSIVTALSSAVILADPTILLREFEEGNTVHITDLNYTFAPTAALNQIYELIAEEVDEAEDMASLSANMTGVDNTVFVSTKGHGRHTARIKIAIDPPDSFNTTAKTASMAIHDYSVRGEYVPTHIAEQAKKFIERNRAVLLDYWEGRINTPAMIAQLKKP
jgi:hypothetical protein